MRGIPTNITEIHGKTATLDILRLLSLSNITISFLLILYYKTVHQCKFVFNFWNSSQICVCICIIIKKKRFLLRCFIKFYSLSHLFSIYVLKQIIVVSLFDYFLTFLPEIVWRKYFNEIYPPNYPPKMMYFSYNDLFVFFLKLN